MIAAKSSLHIRACRTVHARTHMPNGNERQCHGRQLQATSPPAAKATPCQCGTVHFPQDHAKSIVAPSLLTVETHRH